MFYKSQNQRNRQLIHDCLWLLVKMDEDILENSGTILHLIVLYRAGEKAQQLRAHITLVKGFYYYYYFHALTSRDLHSLVPQAPGDLTPFSG